MASAIAGRKLSREILLTTGLTIVAPIVYYAVFHLFFFKAPAPPPKPVDPARAGLPMMTVRVDERQNAGCARVVSPPTTAVGLLQNGYRLTTAVCLEVLAMTGVPGQLLTVRVTDPGGKELPGAPAPSSSVSFLVCAGSQASTRFGSARPPPARPSLLPRSTAPELRPMIPRPMGKRA